MNEEWAGQVVLGSNIDGEPRYDIASPQDFYLPPVTKIYPDIMEDQETKFNSEMSCDERAVSAPQSISANLTASNILMNFLNVMLTASNTDGIMVHKVVFHAQVSTFNNTLTTPTVLRELKVRLA